VARPSDLTPALQGLIADSIGKGVPPEVAAVAAGITARTYYRWKAKGQADEEADLDTPHARFCQALKEAEATAQGLLLETIRLAPETGAKWQAAAWILERRWPRLYSTHAAPESEEERALKLRVLTAQAEAAELALKQARRLAGEGNEDPAEGYWDPSREVVPSSPDAQATGGDPGHLPE
jgi:hypothetical protein